MNREQMKFLLNSPLTSREKIIVMAVAEGFTLDLTDGELSSILGVGYRQMLIDVGNLVRFGLVVYKRWAKRWTINLTEDFTKKLEHLCKDVRDSDNEQECKGERTCEDVQKEHSSDAKSLPLLPPLKLNIDTNRYRSIDIETNKGDKSNRGVGEEREEPKVVQTTTPSSPGVDSPPPPSSAPPPSPKRPPKALAKMKAPLVFEQFWEEYPRKVAKREALAVWIKLDVGPELFIDIMEGLKAYKEKEWKGREIDKIPHARTWLNQRRWEDELDDFRSTPSANQFAGWGIKPKQLPPDDIGW